MCGIIGALARRDVAPLLLDGLKRLEYRGYDSAGLACIDHSAELCAFRQVGRVSDLERSMRDLMPFSTVGIGHTRWATHGEPEVRNAHPQLSRGANDVAVVHNGIIENHENLRRRLEACGYTFQSDTDTEVIAHLIHLYFAKTGDLLESVRLAVCDLTGAYAIAVLAAGVPNTMVAVQRGNPLAIGIAEGELYLASDAVALLPHTNRFVFLEDGDIALIRADDLSISNVAGATMLREVTRLDLDCSSAEKGPYPHYMIKEIHEQPDALADTLQACSERGLLNPEALGLVDRELLARIKAVQIVACGTSFHAAEVAHYWLDRLAHLPCRVDLASEYRYRSPTVQADCLFVALSQSGETADTLAALRYAKRSGYLATLAICNAPESSLIRESDMHFLTRAGPEIGVASTKAFTTQLLSLLLLTLLLARRCKSAYAESERMALRSLRGIGNLVENTLRLNRRIEAMAAQLATSNNALFLGRDVFYPIAKEGALKLKEISYIHAEAYAAGELKHGPLALVDSNMPVIVLAPHNHLLEKLHSNLREVQARRGTIYVFCDPGTGIKPDERLSMIEMPVSDDLSAPIAYSVALQLLAYYAALARGTNVDKPRNLAKAVTVE